MNEYDEIRGKITKKRDELRRRLGLIREVKHHTAEPLNPDSAEQAVEVTNDEVLDTIDEVTRAELEAIEKTFARIENGEFGLCTKCEQPIPIKRLEAVPNAEHCVNCADEAR